MSNQLNNDDLLNEVWSKFNALITSDEDAADAIFQSLVQDSEVDCDCENPQIVRECGERSFSCLTCKRKVWFTAGTLFAGVSRLKAWLAAVWFKEWGVTVSSLRFSRLLGIAQSTALNINKKVAIALVAQMDESAQRVDPKLFSDVIFRRSRHTPADVHPRSELADEGEDENILNGKSRTKDFSDLPHSRSIQQVTVSIAIAAAVAFIRKYFHGVSHKYLQVYLGAFWCHSDRTAWSEGRLLRLCLNHPPISDHDLFNYKASEIRLMPT